MSEVERGGSASMASKGRPLRDAGVVLSAQDEQEVVALANGLSAFMRTQRKNLASFYPLQDFVQVLAKYQAAPLAGGEKVYWQASSAQQNQASTALSASLAAISTSELGGVAWVEIDEQEATDYAAKLDGRRPSARNLLYGYTIGLKDMIAQQGKVSRWGAKEAVFAEPAIADAELVKRLRGADAVIIGRQHMAEFALSPTGFNEWYGPGRSPLATDYISGGSSSGSAMAVGAGHVRAAIGSDTGGSIRLPAACCGVVGLKPTQYAVSTEGVMPLSPSLDCIGPLAATVSDCAEVYAAMIAPVSADAEPVPTAVMSAASANEFTLAVPRFSNAEPLSAPMLTMLEQVQATFSRLGVNLISVPMPDLAQLGNLASVVLSVEAASYHRHLLNKHIESYGQQVARRLARGLLLSGTDYYDALRLRGPLLKKFLQQNMPQAQALLLPVLPDLQPLVSQTVGREQAVLEKEFSLLSWWTRGINYLGLPALSLPVHKTEMGLPMSIQLVGNPYGEQQILRLGYLLEQYLQI